MDRNIFEAPGYALYFKEAWMYCFSKNNIAKYTPTFTCVANCYIIDGMPIHNLQQLDDIYETFAKVRLAKGKRLPYKKWFDTLIDPKSTVAIKRELMDVDVGCFEMAEIEGTLDDMVKDKEPFDLGIIFEYLYSKVVCAFIGSVIFTDDHFGNVAYKTVKYTRHYRIKCNGCYYDFYIKPGRLVQFIDLERYVFNFSPYDIYTNTALKSVTDGELVGADDRFNRLKMGYLQNNYIFDKSISAFLSPKQINETNFVSKSDIRSRKKL